MARFFYYNSDIWFFSRTIQSQVLGYLSCIWPGFHLIEQAFNPTRQWLVAPTTFVLLCTIVSCRQVTLVDRGICPELVFSFLTQQHAEYLPVPILVHRGEGSRRFQLGTSSTPLCSVGLTGVVCLWKAISRLGNSLSCLGDSMGLLWASNSIRCNLSLCGVRNPAVALSLLLFGETPYIDFTHAYILRIFYCTRFSQDSSNGPSCLLTLPVFPPSLPLLHLLFPLQSSQTASQQLDTLFPLPQNCLLLQSLILYLTSVVTQIVAPLLKA